MYKCQYEFGCVCFCVLVRFVCVSLCVCVCLSVCLSVCFCLCSCVMGACVNVSVISFADMCVWVVLPSLFVCLCVLCVYV